MRWIALLSLLLTSGLAQAYCFEQAGARFGLSPVLLKSVSNIENKKGNPSAIRPNQNGSVDIGLMQINSTHLNELSRYGITMNSLLDPCTNVMVGAWLLAKHVARDGMTWKAIGSYHSRTPGLREAYGERVRQQVIRNLASNGY